MATVTVEPIELLALKKLALINGAVATSLKDPTDRKEQVALLRVLMDIIARVDRAAATGADNG